MAKSRRRSKKVSLSLLVWIILIELFTDGVMILIGMWLK